VLIHQVSVHAHGLISILNNFIPFIKLDKWERIGLVPSVLLLNHKIGSGIVHDRRNSSNIVEAIGRVI
jgi:hypothetical protein